MDENFTQAALRHWRDAELLKDQNRVENADQLYGITAECAIKHALLRSKGFCAAGKLLLAYKEHLPVLWGRINPQANSSLNKQYPELLAILKTPNRFQDWEITQRYCADGAISTDKIETHREAARKLLTNAGLHGSRKK